MWKSIIRLGLGKKADIITKYKQQQQQQEKASEVTVIIGYTKWHGGPQLKEMKQTHTYNRNMDTDGSSTRDDSGGAGSGSSGGGRRFGNAFTAASSTT